VLSGRLLRLTGAAGEATRCFRKEQHSRKQKLANAARASERRRMNGEAIPSPAPSAALAIIVHAPGGVSMEIPSVVVTE
jgi:hypothetical protein